VKDGLLTTISPSEGTKKHDLVATRFPNEKKKHNLAANRSSSQRENNNNKLKKTQWPLGRPLQFRFKHLFFLPR
jgi:hypothetical protein